MNALQRISFIGATLMVIGLALGVTARAANPQPAADVGTYPKSLTDERSQALGMRLARTGNSQGIGSAETAKNLPRSDFRLANSAAPGSRNFFGRSERP